jgi:mRNA turnover protein 4
MPRSKKSKVVSLTKVQKKGREHKENLLQEVQQNVDQWKHIWIFSVGHMRNTALKDVRERWKGSGRIIYGRTTVMAKALGTTVEEERKPGLRHVAERLKGPVGLFFTDTPPDEVIEWFASFYKPDFARSGNIAPKDVTLPAGPIVQYNDPDSTFPSSMDPQFRKLGLTTKLQRGIPSLEVPHVVCRKGDKLTPEQTQILKLVGEQLAVFRIKLVGRWEEEEGWVDVEGPVEEGGSAGSEECDEEADEEMEEDEVVYEPKAGA